MTQYERIAHFEITLKLRDQRRQRVAHIALAVLVAAAVVAACFLMTQ